MKSPVDRNKIIAFLLDKKVQDYSYLIGFFLAFAFFTLFAIRPNLITAFNLQKELQDIKLKNREFEEQILQIVNYQTIVEQNRDSFYLIDEALPTKPTVVKIVADIQKIAEENNIDLQSVNVESLNFDQEKKVEKLNTLQLDLTANASLSQVQLLLKSILNQRRIKTVTSIKVSKAETEFETYSISMQIIGYYL